MIAARLLVVEDDPELRDVLARGLREHGFMVTTARDAATAMGLAKLHVDALVLDVGLPDADGRDLCQALRAKGIDAPVLFLTAHDRVEDRLAGFAAGGDDYLAKPFHLVELAARLTALLRRATAPPGPVPGLDLDPLSHDLSTATGRTALTPTEFRILATLIGAAGTVLRRRELIRAGWPDGAIVHDNTLDQYVARLRRKLREVVAPGTISTAHGVGYRFEIDG
ncbi:MAG: response regulator transcription factor [Frankiales bacterium]|nr:response regulator transcription factor [Frankiales bacterium]